jgi:leader peptidase (prepilin peptidase)/N-methyltransferase
MMVDIFAEAPGLYLYLSMIVFWFGACFGSFLNVCIYRIPENISVVKPRSRCPKCLKQIGWRDNIPLLSWSLLRGKCRNCRVPISARYFTVELLTAVIFVLIWLQYSGAPAARPLGLVWTGFILHVPVFWLFAFGLILGTFVDFDHMIIPDRVSLGGIVLGLICSFLVPTLQLQPGETDITGTVAIFRSAIGAAVGGGLLYGIGCIGKVMFRKDAMGLGDVKLLAAIGAFLGWQATIFTAMISSAIGAVVGIVLIVFCGREMGSRIPFGPYISVAALIWVLWGTPYWYDWVEKLSYGY